MEKTFEPRMLAFLCNWCSYAGADLAGVSRFQYPPTIRIVRTMCSGRVDPVHVVEGLRSGYDCVLVFGCHFGDCHYVDGNLYTAKRMEVVKWLLEYSGVGSDRAEVRWVSAAEGQIFADYVKELTERTQKLGPFDPEKYRLPLAAVAGVLNSVRFRWLMGMERQLTERENVYHQKLEEEGYRSFLKTVARIEYQKALIMEVLKEGALSVREISEKTGLPVYEVSLRLSDLERAGQVELKGYEGTTPRFISLAA
ncbi:MAG: hydrogenase iron-sulfur subunit [Syntrophobacteraceae bacterium]|nr:hydrogenase iron-sulfur subunit [Syntrophobacteraceae bacterium]